MAELGRPGSHGTETVGGRRPGMERDGPKKESLAESLVRTEEEYMICLFVLDACSDQRGMAKGGRVGS